MKSIQLKLIIPFFIIGSLHGDTAQRERIAQKLNLTPESCKPSLTLSNWTKEDINYHFSCFVTQNAPLFYATNLTYERLKQELDPMRRPLLEGVGLNYKEFIIFSPLSNTIFSPALIMYNPQSKKNGLLLEKYLLEVSLFSTLLTQESIKNGTASGSSVQKIVRSLLKTEAASSGATIPFDNEYLVGKLLGYTDKELEFLYQRYYYFLQGANSGEDQPESDNKSGYVPLKKWPLEKQKAFAEYLKSSPAWQEAFSEEKRAAEQWLTINNKYSIQQLKYGCDAFLQPLYWFKNPDNLLKNPQTEQLMKRMIKIERILPRMQARTNE